MATQISGDTGVSQIQDNTVTSTKIVDGSVANQDFLVADWTFTHGTTGSQRLSTGLIIKWGAVSATAGGQAVTFASAFPTACYAVFLTSNGTGTYYQTHASAVSTSGFTATSPSGTLAMFWFAIGK